MPLNSRQKQAAYRARHGAKINERQRERRRKKKALADREKMLRRHGKKALALREKKRKLEARHGLPIAKLTAKKSKSERDVDALREKYLRRRKVLAGILSALDSLDDEAKKKGVASPKRPKEKTILGYIQALERLHVRIFNSPMDGLAWLEDHEFVLKKVEDLYRDKTIGAKSSVVNAITAIIGRTVNYAHVYPEYSRKNSEIASLRAEEGVRNKLDKGREYVLPWSELMKKVEPALKMGKGSAKDRMIVRLFTLFPPRRCMDFQLMRVGYGTNSSKKFNYLDLSHGRFIFNVYKTAKIYGQQVFNIPEDLLRYLREYVSGKKTGDFLFESSPGLYYVTFSSVVRNGFRAMTGALDEAGRSMTANDLRHSYVTWWIKEEDRTVKSRNALAKMMGHSRAMQDLYFKIDLIRTK